MVKDSSKVKRKYQLIIRLKANKCYRGLLCYLFSYNILILQTPELIIVTILEVVHIFVMDSYNYPH